MLRRDRFLVRYGAILLAASWPLTGLRSEVYFPDSDLDWETTSSELAGADSQLLEEAIAYAGSNESDALVVLHKGKILAEAYWNDFGRGTKGPSYSAAKSYVSILTGIAIERGFIESIDQKSADFLEEWRDVPSKQGLLLRHHLSMTTGFEERRFGLLALQASENERRFGAEEDLEYPAGSRWWYNDAAYRLLFYVLEEASGMDLAAFSEKYLFEPIGIEQTEWVIREGIEDGKAIDNYQWLNYTALDAARFGLLALNKGAWKGEQIVSKEWIETSTRPQYEHAPWYGQLWWLNGASFHKLPGVDEVRQGPIAPDVPPDMFAALGAFDQKIYVIPSLDLVVVRLGGAARESSLAVGIFDNLLLGRICRAFGYSGQEEPVSGTLASEGLGVPTLEISFPKWNGRTYRIEGSLDLKEWQRVSDNDVFDDGHFVRFEVSHEIMPFVRYVRRIGLGD